MKAGPHSGNTLDEIINMKLEEESKLKRFYWGYSGSLCHPYVVQKFCKEATELGKKVKLLLTPTKSNYNPRVIKKVTEFSMDNIRWYSLPQGVHLWNCKYAIIAKNLKKSNIFINLGEYIVFPNRRPLINYLKGRVNKACAILSNTRHGFQPLYVSYVANVIEPFCIFLR